MRDLFAALTLGLLGLVNAVPSEAALHPTAATIDNVDDDIAGSGREANEQGVTLPQRRHALRLRVRSDSDRATLLRVIDGIPVVVVECLPQCAGDPARAALVLQLIRALYERRPMSVDALAARNGLSSRAVLRQLDQLEAGGLVRLTPKPTRGSGARWVMPTGALRAAANEILERLYSALAIALNEPSPSPAPPLVPLSPPSRIRREG